MAPANNRSGWLSRLGGFILIWLASVAAMGAAALGMRLLMRAAGLTAG